MSLFDGEEYDMRERVLALRSKEYLSNTLDSIYIGIATTYTFSV